MKVDFVCRCMRNLLQEVVKDKETRVLLMDRLLGSVKAILRSFKDF